MSCTVSDVQAYMNAHIFFRCHYVSVASYNLQLSIGVIVQTLPLHAF